MEKLHINSITDNNFVSKEGQRDLMCSNKESVRCPSLDYKCITASSDLADRAFDLLFEEAAKLSN